MVEQRLERGSKNTEMVQYIRNGKLETEAGIWNWKQSAKELKWNSKNQNVVGGLRGWSEVSDNSDIVLEVLEDDDVELEISEDGWNGIGEQ